MSGSGAGMTGGGNEKGLRFMVRATIKRTGAVISFDTPRDCALALRMPVEELLRYLDGQSENKIWEFENVDGKELGYSFDDYGTVFEEPVEDDAVNHPSHYTNGTIECIDCVEAVAGSYEGAEGFLVGNVVKYLYRANNKNGLEDLEKAFWYLNRLLVERHAAIELAKGKGTEAENA